MKEPIDIIQTLTHQLYHISMVQQSLVHVVLEILPQTETAVKGLDLGKLKAALDKLSETTGEQKEYRKQFMKEMSDAST